MQLQSTLHRYFTPRQVEAGLVAPRQLRSVLHNRDLRRIISSFITIILPYARMKLEMMRHRSRLWRTLLCCLGATGPALALLLSTIAEGGVAFSNIGLGWRTLHCCDANSHS